MTSISSPKLLTPKIHKEVLNSLRVALETMKNTQPLSDEMKKIRIRNWLFIYEEGLPTIDIILDKDYKTNDVENNITPRFANTSLSFDECAQIHEYILATDALDAISNDVQVRFGTPGSEPTLYNLEDFQAAVGDMVRLETWEPKDGRTKFVMILVDIFQKEGNSIAVVSEGPHRFEFNLEDIKSAFSLPFHPASKSVKSKKKTGAKSKTK
jgi:ribosome maturation factor RimP